MHTDMTAVTLCKLLDSCGEIVCMGSDSQGVLDEVCLWGKTGVLCSVVQMGSIHASCSGQSGADDFSGG